MQKKYRDDMFMVYNFEQYEKEKENNEQQLAKDWKRKKEEEENMRVRYLCIN